MKLHTARCFHLNPVHAVLFTQHKISLHCLTSFMEKISSFNERESKHFTSVSLSHSSKLVLIQRATNQTHSKNSQILTYSVPVFQILGLSIRIYQYSPLRFKRSADMSINSAQKVVWSYTSTVCVCAVDTSCAHFSLSQLPPLIFSKHSYLQNSPLTKQVVLLHSFLALLQQNFLPAGVALQLLKFW